MAIKFGTDGWRAKIADEFTFANLELVTKALILSLKESQPENKLICVGYDNRFQSEDFAKRSAQVCAAFGYKVLLANASLPSPVLSFYTKKHQAAIGIMITASHNPPEWNGFKLKEAYGGSAQVETTQAVEKNLEKAQQIKATSAKGEIIPFDPKKDYFDYLAKKFDLSQFNGKDIKLVVDPMYGSGLGYVKEFLAASSVQVTEINNYRDPLFGGKHPEPLPIYLEDLIDVTQSMTQQYPESLVLGTALDGDADRIAGADGNFGYISSHQAFILILKHLVENKKLSGKVVKTFNITQIVDKMCQKYKKTLDITPIGFKYLAKKMIAEDVIMGGEESGGLGVKDHLPERDAVFNTLLLLELVAKEEKPLGVILNELMEKHGFYYYNRIDLHLEEAKKQKLMAHLKDKTPGSFAGKKVIKVETLDGFKMFFEDDSWILFRASGTEPLLRIYSEARSNEDLKLILGAGEKLAKA